MVKIEVFALVVGSSIFHASWNFLARKTKGNVAVLWLSFAFGATLCIPVAIYFMIQQLKDTDFDDLLPGLYCAFASGGVKSISTITLSLSYKHGDISLVYPIARGSGVGIVSIVSYFAFKDFISDIGWSGIACIIAGVISLGLGLRIQNLIVRTFFKHYVKDRAEIEQDEEDERADFRATSISDYPFTFISFKKSSSMSNISRANSISDISMVLKHIEANKSEEKEILENDKGDKGDNDSNDRNGLHEQRIDINDNDKDGVALPELEPTENSTANSIESSPQITEDSKNIPKKTYSSPYRSSSRDDCNTEIKPTGTATSTETTPEKKPDAPITKALILAMVTGAIISCYSIIDSLGVNRYKFNPVTYIVISESLSALVASFYILNKHYDEVLLSIKTLYKYILFIGPCSFSSSLAVLFAFSMENASYVVAMREFSVVIGSILGFILLKEKLRVYKILGIVCIAAGLILVKLS